MLPDEEIQRRIKAVRILRGMSQTELGALLATDGLGKHDVGRIERGTLTMQRAHRESICRHLRVPEAWLTNPDLDELLGFIPDANDVAIEVPPLVIPGDTDDDTLSSIRGILEQVLARVDQVAGRAGSETKRAQGDTGPSEERREGSGG